MCHYGQEIRGAEYGGERKTEDTLFDANFDGRNGQKSYFECVRTM